MNGLLLAAAIVGIDPGLLSAVCFVESGHNPAAYAAHDGGTPSYGICQIKLVAAQQVGYTGTGQGLMDPEINALYAAKYLKYQYTRYGNWFAGIYGYNRGYYSNSPTNYVQKVVAKLGTAKWQKLNAIAVKRQKRSISLPSLMTIVANAEKK